MGAVLLPGTIALQELRLEELSLPVIAAVRRLPARAASTVAAVRALQSQRARWGAQGGEHEFPQRPLQRS